MLRTQTTTVHIAMKNITIFHHIFSSFVCVCTTFIYIFLYLSPFAKHISRPMREIWAQTVQPFSQWTHTYTHLHRCILYSVFVWACMNFARITKLWAKNSGETTERQKYIHAHICTQGKRAEQMKWEKMIHTECSDKKYVIWNRVRWHYTLSLSLCVLLRLLLVVIFSSSFFFDCVYFHFSNNAP